MQLKIRTLTSLLAGSEGGCRDKRGEMIQPVLPSACLNALIDESDQGDRVLHRSGQFISNEFIFDISSQPPYEDITEGSQDPVTYSSPGMKVSGVICD